MSSFILSSEEIYTLTCYFMSEASLFVCDPLEVGD